MRRAAVSTGFLAAVVAVAAALATGPNTGPLAVPPSDPGLWAGWLASQPPEVAVFGAIRLGVVALAGHSAALAVVAVVAGVARRPTAARAVEAAAAPGARAVVRWAAAAGLALATLTAPAAAAPSPSRAVVAAAAEDPPVVRRLDDDPSPAPSPPSPAPTTAEWVVRPGDHLWAVAEETMAASLGREPSDREVAPYWVQVVEANRTRLADPANPDLVYPGQVLALPPVPPPA